MDFFKSEVKKYQKKYKKKTKSGNVREASTLQYSIQLQKDNPFKEEDFIYLLKKSELEDLLNKIDEYDDSYTGLESENHKLKEEIKRLQLKKSGDDKALAGWKEEKSDLLSKNADLQKKLDDHISQVQELIDDKDKLQGDLDRLRNKYDHLQERFNKSQLDLIRSEKESKNYSEVKGSLKTLKSNLEQKGRIARWVAGLDGEIEILNENLKLLTGNVTDQTESND